MSINKICIPLLATAVLLFSAVSFAGKNAHAIAYCGHEDDNHDGVEFRHYAGKHIHWKAKEGYWKSPIRFKILGFNDFHGALEQRSLSGRPVGGAAVLAAYFEAEAAAAENGAILVHAGDHVGATPPISALLQDEPSIDFLNMLANKHCRGNKPLPTSLLFNKQCNIVGTLGNHEFDEGVDEMLRLIRGGNHANGPFLDDPFKGAAFPYVSANVVYEESGKPVLPPFTIVEVKGKRIAFIGAVLQQTPSIVTPTGVAGVQFLDEADSINKYVRVLKRMGIRAIVVTIHQGAGQTSFGGETGEQPTPLGGAIGDIVNRLNDEVDIVITGHAHGFTNQLVENQNGKVILVTQAFSASTAYADIDVTLDKKTGDIIEKSAEIVTTWADEGPGLTPKNAVTNMVAEAAARVAPLVSRVVGEASAELTRTESPAGESALGNLIADAQKAAMNTDIAFMNPGGIRDNLNAGEVTWGELFSIQPFNNDLVRMELTGEQILTLLNQQWSGANSVSPRILKSSGISYTWDASLPAENRVVVNSVTIGGSPLTLGAIYSVTVNSFIAAGGDNFTLLTSGTNRVIGPVDLDALVDYVEALPQPFSAAIEGRIQRLN